MQPREVLFRFEDGEEVFLCEAKGRLGVGDILKNFEELGKAAKRRIEEGKSQMGRIVSRPMRIKQEIAA